MALGMPGMDPGALQQKALEAAQKIGQEQGALGTPTQAPGANDVERFKAALDGGQTQPPPGATPPGEANAVPPAGGPPPAAGMGDRILQGMSQASQKIAADREVAAQALGNENVTQADLLRANFAMIESSTLVSAVSKTSEKITQGLKTLQQG